MSKRAEIAMTAAEAADFLGESKIVTVATLGRDGWPHLMPLWYIVRDGTLWAWTYAKSQKVRNLERDARCTLQVETGEMVYSELRGVVIKARAVIHREIETVLDTGLAVAARYAGAELPDGAREALRAQAAKRVALEFREHSRATWDHRKLGGAY